MTYSALAAPRFATCAGTRWFRHAPRTLDHNEPDRKNPFKPVASNWLAEHRSKLPLNGQTLPSDGLGGIGVGAMPGRSLPSEIELTLGLDELEEANTIRTRIARILGCATECVPTPVVVRRAIDARRGKVRFRIKVALATAVNPRVPSSGAAPREVSGHERVIIIGDGPAGLFCAYELACHAILSIVIERGKTVQPRRHDLKSVLQRGIVNPDSNYCFGEGGAGTYSDGKLYTRATKRGEVRRVLELLVEHGAPSDILIDARPHIGSNNLPKVVVALREHLRQVGVEFRFETRVTGLDFNAGATPRVVRGALCADGTSIGADAVVLATGHSARDVYDWLLKAGCTLEPKSFALGLRCEHPQEIINRSQYGRYAQHPRLPNAAYQLAYSEQGQGVFSFCMCPGGFIVPATTEPDAVVVNGMSLSRRDSPYANSGIVASIRPEEWSQAGFDAVLGGMELQRALEQAAYAAGGGAFRAPAARLTDFMASRASSDLPKSSYQPGLTSVNLDEIFAVGRLPVGDKIRNAMAVFGRRMPGFVTNQAVLVGVESRTSSPVRIPRNPNSLENPDLWGLYPVGEGAGFAGGIISAALDGIRAAQALARQLGRA